MSMSVLPAHMSILLNAPGGWWLQKPEESAGSPGNGVTMVVGHDVGSWCGN